MEWDQQCSEGEGDVAQREGVGDCGEAGEEGDVSPGLVGHGHKCCEEAEGEKLWGFANHARRSK